MKQIIVTFIIMLCSFSTKFFIFISSPNLNYANIQLTISIIWHQSFLLPENVLCQIFYFQFVPVSIQLYLKVVDNSAIVKSKTF